MTIAIGLLIALVAMLITRYVAQIVMAFLWYYKIGRSVIHNGLYGVTKVTKASDGKLINVETELYETEVMALRCYERWASFGEMEVNLKRKWFIAWDVEKCEKFPYPFNK